MGSDRYQYILIFSGALVAILLGIFFYRELFPEYMIYQDDYIALEEFRSTYTGELPPLFKKGVKQIVLEREDKGPPTIDRCTSCHVALQIPDFSPTEIARDINGNVLRDEQGIPRQIPNKNYIWAKLDQKIEELGDGREAEKYLSLKTAVVGDHIYDVTKVLTMHPLMGKETRPFEFHPIEEYGCTSCHNGNGRGLTTEKAHGPIFDGDYAIEFSGPKPEFLENDPQNDPRFSRVFNDKPGHELLFQTSPLYVGALIQAKCIQCHQPSSTALQNVANSTLILTNQRGKKSQAIKTSFSNEKQALLSYLNLQNKISQGGLQKTIQSLQAQIQDPSQTEKKISELKFQLLFLKNIQEKDVLPTLDDHINQILGSPKLKEALTKLLATTEDPQKTLEKFLKESRGSPEATGTLFVKLDELDLDQELMRHVADTQMSFTETASDEQTISAISSDVDALIKNYHRGEQLYISQACYACHRIAGLARGGVGPELTRSGNTYPWYVKESIVWPQADLKTSTMPNYRMDHQELEDLVTFLLGQKGGNSTIAPTAYKIAVQEWEGGRKMPWEMPISPPNIRNLRYSMTVFATEGCAACHRLKGFESNVGYKIEKEGSPATEALYEESNWFQRLFPETITGSQIVKALENYSNEIDQRIEDHVRKDSILEEISKRYPQLIEALYSNFRFAARAKNSEFKEKISNEQDLTKKQHLQQEWKEWTDRIHRVLMVYIQEYGLGRIIGPKPNWSGVYRSDQWLMEHFKNPSAHIPRSIMPVMPFDETKFYALTYMLDVLGKQNRDSLRKIWDLKGFNPPLAFQIYCAQCHGEHLQGNGPVSEWIYPIPKNLRNTTFLQNLTKERAIESIIHGVKGTPMSPWGETPTDKPTFDGVPVLTKEEVQMLVDWIFSSIPRESSPRNIPKWEYQPEDVIEELQREGNSLGKVHSKLSLAPASLFLATSFTSNSEDLFDKYPISPESLEKNSFYIKQRWYTPQNLANGKSFFELNCAVCHGKEADGTGIRAGVMAESKPRALTNLDWIESRDDLRLLRSIKYGVPGTSMTPWGDLTSSLQRLQLVMYIRSLSASTRQREELTNTLYIVFDRAKITLDSARNLIYPEITKIEQQIEESKSLQKALYFKIESGNEIPSNAIEEYQKELSLVAKLKKLQNIDDLLSKIKKLIEKDRETYFGIGMSLLTLDPAPTSWGVFLKLIELKNEEFVLEEGKLFLKDEPTKQAVMNGIANSLLQQAEEKLDSLEREGGILKGKIPTTSSSAELQILEAKEENYRKFIARLLSGLKQSKEIHQQELEYINEVQNQLKKSDDKIQ